jgi:FkbM family methyltransferase
LNENKNTPNNEHFRTVNSRYGILSVFANDVGAVTKSLIEYGEWAENELEFLHFFVDVGASVVDVGAYIGTHTIAFAHFVGPTGRIISIEPQPITFELLKSNIEINSLSNIDLRNAVVSFEPAKLLIPTIQIENQSSFGSASLLSIFSSHPEDEKHTDISPLHIEIDAITIDLLALDACALIKIDAEGMENLVLRGARQTIEKHRPVIYAECNSVEAGIKTVKLLKDTGYHVLAHIVPAFNPNNFRGNTNNLFNTGCEVAIVGLSDASMAQVENYTLSTGELLLGIETADDLVLALLNKPQYPMEVLRNGLAAKGGGTRCLDTADAIRFDAERLRTRILETDLAYREAAAEAERLRTRILETDLAYREAAAEAERLRTRILETDLACRAAEDDLRAICRSRSWRITSPLRWLGKCLRGS